MNQFRRFSLTTAIAVVVANMVGTGVFTSLGYQLVDIQSEFVLLLLWFVGGIAALCGALTYAELSASLPRSGGEYNFLSRIYHPAMGFVSGWVSITVGFAAPTALAAMTFAAYLSAALAGTIEINREFAAIALVVVLTVVHASSRRASSGFQQWLTFLKIILILLFCAVVSWFAEFPQSLELLPVSSDIPIITGGAFAISLIYVNYAYTGWNAATYIASEIENPQKNVPLVMIVGTVMVMALYLLLNAVFLYAAPMHAMEGKIEIGVIVAETTFGPRGALVMGFVLSLLLISTVSAMIMAGPRVLQVIGEDFRVFSWLGRLNSKGIPALAIYFQSVLSILFISTATFESILVFSGFILGINSLFAVVGVFVLRYRKIAVDHTGYKTIGYPVTPLIYIAITTWTVTFISINRIMEVAVGVAVIVIGLVVYFVSNRWQANDSAR
ncbi:MAG: amino acid permease [bacterium]|nr:amino acid permease [Gammaproteobacteria bacterium]HIL98356.1 amino acid permease [Pseudomonadales bacterium]